MILGVGIDLIEVPRIARALERFGERFERRVYTGGELLDCAGRADRTQALAARFAAKEAALKALGTGWAAGLAWDQVEVARGEAGRPDLLLHGEAERRARRMGATRWHVSLTHQPGIAGATVILEGVDG